MLLRGKVVFIVEDNSQNRIVYQIMMVRNGARVEFDRWGRDTIDRMKTLDQIDIILMDLMLPSGDSGFVIFETIRKNRRFDAIPIVAVSAADPSTALPRTQQMGFSGFIGKPINDDLFPGQLARILAGEKVWYAGDHYDISG